AEAPADGDCGVRSSLVRQLVPGNAAFDIDARLTVEEGDLHAVKKTASVFHPQSGSDLLQTLQSRGIKTLVITGIVTNGCCETTARDASQHGFQILFASDATGAMSEEEHRAALLNLALWFAEVQSADELVALAADQGAAASLAS
ncbi:MAG: isochorismatase family protein, partial [Sphingopyxis sp.]